MKQNRAGILRQTCIAWLMAAAAPLVGAQTPTPASTAPAPATPAPATPAAEPAAAPSVDELSYKFGLTFGEQMHRGGVTDQLVMDAIMRGIQDGLQGKKTAPTDQRQLQAYMRSLIEAAVARNQAAAKEFLERNAHEKGVTVTASGLQYKIIAPGDRKAAAIAIADQVTVQYRGRLLDGSEFDSSYAHGAPATFSVNGVIRGWQEALLLMKPGAKWQVFVPPDLAYGSFQNRGIPGGSLLIFDLELVSVKSAAAAAPQGAKPAPKQP